MNTPPGEVSAANFRSLRPSLQLAIVLAAGSVILAVGYLSFPNRSAYYVIPAYFAIQGFVSLWASGQAFSANTDSGGCGVGVALWLWLSLESMVLGALWLAWAPGPL